jgi:hypothetical protein
MARSGRPPSVLRWLPVVAHRPPEGPRAPAWARGCPRPRTRTPSSEKRRAGARTGAMGGRWHLAPLEQAILQPERGGSPNPLHLCVTAECRAKADHRGADAVAALSSRYGRPDCSSSWTLKAPAAARALPKLAERARQRGGGATSASGTEHLIAPGRARGASPGGSPTRHRVPRRRQPGAVGGPRSFPRTAGAEAEVPAPVTTPGDSTRRTRGSRAASSTRFR